MSGHSDTKMVILNTYKIICSGHGKSAHEIRYGSDGWWFFRYKFHICLNYEIWNYGKFQCVSVLFAHGNHGSKTLTQI